MRGNARRPQYSPHLPELRTQHGKLSEIDRYHNSPVIQVFSCGETCTAVIAHTICIASKAAHLMVNMPNLPLAG